MVSRVRDIVIIRTGALAVLAKFTSNLENALVIIATRVPHQWIPGLITILETHNRVHHLFRIALIRGKWLWPWRHEILSISAAFAKSWGAYTGNTSLRWSNVPSVGRIGYWMYCSIPIPWLKGGIWELKCLTFITLQQSLFERRYDYAGTYGFINRGKVECRREVIGVRHVCFCRSAHE
jgi:hypothetical protein